VDEPTGSSTGQTEPRINLASSPGPAQPGLGPDHEPPAVDAPDNGRLVVALEPPEDDRHPPRRDDDREQGRPGDEPIAPQAPAPVLPPDLGPAPPRGQHSL